MKMFNNDTDGDWEYFGKNDPYFGVSTHDKFLKSNLSDEARKEFFGSSYDYIDNILDKIRTHIDPCFSIKQALDFGCGVGRMIVALANVAEEVTGVDVSDSMLDEARKNCEALSIKNVLFVKSDDSLSLLTGNYDFIHSFIVFQHIPVARGERIFENLIAHLEGGGIGVVHFTYAKDYKIKRLAPLLKNYIPFAENFINVIEGKSFRHAPEMQMNDYDLNRLFFMIQKANVLHCFTEFTNHFGNLGIIVYFRKPTIAR